MYTKTIARHFGNTHTHMHLPLSLPLSMQVILPPTYESLLYLLGDALLYGLLAWYLDAVIRGVTWNENQPLFIYSYTYTIDSVNSMCPFSL